VVGRIDEPDSITARPSATAFKPHQKPAETHILVLGEEAGEGKEALFGNFLLHSCRCKGPDNDVTERRDGQKGIACLLSLDARVEDPVEEFLGHIVVQLRIRWDDDHLQCK
jgi:hypothetical protein